MENKTLQILEYQKILDKLVEFTSFAPSADLALALLPTNDLLEATQLQAQTREAVHLFVKNTDLTIGGARDIREALELALHGGVLSPVEFLDIKSTLTSARNLSRSFDKIGYQYPHLMEFIQTFYHPVGIIEAITKVISDHAEILDSASQKLGTIRRELAISRERLIAKMQRYVSDPQTAVFLQENLITQREGRFVLPLRTEFKGRIKAIVHDQSASGATLFVEPIQVVEQNNKIRELQLDERNEERRILMEMSALIATHAEEITITLQAIANLDLIFARAKLANALQATEPHLLPLTGKGKTKDTLHPGSVIRLYQARHPLLDPKTVVPIDVELEKNTYAMVITGPNTGGKTVTLKTIGLITLMALSGLHIPASSGSEVSVFHDIYADIGDEQSIEQSLSTFSGHVTNIIHILEKADSRSIVILDELGAGTDPQEGSALARAILSHLLDSKITTLVTTHHPELKTFAHVTPGATNANVEFDLETLSPTFRLTIGLPGRSNALAIAERLGMPNHIIQKARADIDPQELHVDNLLDEIQHQRELARQAYQLAEKARNESEKIRVELSTRLEEIESERKELMEQASNEVELEMTKFHDELRNALRIFTRSNQPVEEILEQTEIVESIAVEIQKPHRHRRHIPKPNDQPRPFRVGDKVRLSSMNTIAEISAIDGEQVEVLAGSLRIRSDLNGLTLVREKEAAQEPPIQPSIRLPVHTETPGWELDLRGLRSDEALTTLERYLDSASYSGLPFARIIHGRGTGKLRQVIRQALERHPQVKSHEPGGDKEGGDGVTVVKFE